MCGLTCRFIEIPEYIHLVTSSAMLDLFMPSHALYTKIEYTELVIAFILLGIVAALALAGAIFCCSLMLW